MVQLWRSNENSPLRRISYFLVVGVVLGGPAGIAVATVWTLDPHVAVFVGAAIPLVILGLARSTDRKHCPKCKSEIKAGSRGE